MLDLIFSNLENITNIECDHSCWPILSPLSVGLTLATSSSASMSLPWNVNVGYDFRHANFYQLYDSCKLRLISKRNKWCQYNYNITESMTVAAMHMFNLSVQ